MSLPKYMIRTDDYEIFSLNEDGMTYSNRYMKMEFKDHLHHKYTYEVLKSHKFYETSDENKFQEYYRMHLIAIAKDVEETNREMYD